MRQAHAKQLYQRHKGTFSRATVTSLLASIVDFGSLWAMVEFGHIYYVLATALAAAFGAVTNFLLNRYWAFSQRPTTSLVDPIVHTHYNHNAIHKQFLRYALVSGMSLCLNTLFVFSFTEFGHLRYLVSKAIAAILVGWGWNYPMHRVFVFKNGKRI